MAWVIEALVDIITDHTCADVSRVACAPETALEVETLGIPAAWVCQTFVNVSANKSISSISLFAGTCV
jgi:hypothetical protein